MPFCNLFMGRPSYVQFYLQYLQEHRQCCLTGSNISTFRHVTSLHIRSRQPQLTQTIILSFRRVRLSSLAARSAFQTDSRLSRAAPISVTYRHHYVINDLCSQYWSRGHPATNKKKIQEKRSTDKTSTEKTSTGGKKVHRNNVHQEKTSTRK